MITKLGALDAWLVTRLPFVVYLAWGVVALTLLALCMLLVPRRYWD